MTNKYRSDVIIKLIDKNVDGADSERCSIRCAGVQCVQCPIGNDDESNLGEIRKMDPRVKTEKATVPTPVEDPSVKQPSHYQVFDGLESISVIARSMTVEQFKGFCMGNVLKYRLRAGKKSDQANVTKDLAKAEFYKELFEKHKGECHVAE